MCLDLECQTLGLQKNNVNVGFLKQTSMIIAGLVMYSVMRSFFFHCGWLENSLSFNFLLGGKIVLVLIEEWQLYLTFNHIFVKGVKGLLLLFSF